MDLQSSQMLSMLLLLTTFVLQIFVHFWFKKAVNKYSKMTARNGRTGYSMAIEMLQKHGIYDVQIIQGTNFLSDCYNQKNKTITLSPDVYHGNSIMAQAVACHEVGHAVQWHKGYEAISIRNLILPIANFASKVLWFLFILLFLGIFLNFVSFSGMITIIMGIVIALGCIAIFQLVTLPIEFDASKRAKEYLKQNNFLTQEEFQGAKIVLNRAAMTYVIAFISTILTIAAYIIRFTALARR
ncbi:MAG: zinc metallopeptidase [Mycoplasma sp.]